MKIRLLSVGKPKDARLIALHDDYAQRLGRLGVDYESRFVPEVRSFVALCAVALALLILAPRRSAQEDS